MDMTTNWCIGGCWFTLINLEKPSSVATTHLKIETAGTCYNTTSPVATTHLKIETASTCYNTTSPVATTHLKIETACTCYNTKETKNSLWWFDYKPLKLGGMLIGLVICFLVVKIETSKLQHYIIDTLSELFI
jgi:hypothetical protein